MEYPFLQYNGYLIVNNQNRRMVILRNSCTKDMTTISYARYLICVKEKRMLSKEEQVDHIDEDKTNDSVNNLQILSVGDNIRKNFSNTNRTELMVKLKCPNCNELFTRRKGNTFLGKKGLFSTCSRKCLHEFLMTSRSENDLKKIGENQIIEYFRK